MIETEIKDWYPSKREYDPGIKEKQWEELVRDESIFTKNSLVTFACIQNATSGTCAGMAKQYGRSANFYNTNVWQTGMRIADKLKYLFVKTGNKNTGWCVAWHDAPETVIQSLKSARNWKLLLTKPAY